jgi:CheY-like chemotaxis protein
MEANTRLIDILLVEDSPSDAMMTREALNDSRLLSHLYTVTDGEKAIAFLRRQAGFADAPRPGLILLDLNLPKKSGQEVLEEIKNDEQLKTIPVVVLTTSRAEDDVLKAYRMHANCYITKPVEFSKLVDAVDSIRKFWLTTATLPPVHPA